MSFIPSSALWICINHKIQPHDLTHFSSGSKLSKVFDRISDSLAQAGWTENFEYRSSFCAWSSREGWVPLTALTHLQPPPSQLYLCLVQPDCYSTHRAMSCLDSISLGSTWCAGQEHSMSLNRSQTTIQTALLHMKNTQTFLLPCDSGFLPLGQIGHVSRVQPLHLPLGPNPPGTQKTEQKSTEFYYEVVMDSQI